MSRRNAVAFAAALVATVLAQAPAAAQDLLPDMNSKRRAIRDTTVYTMPSRNSLSMGQAKAGQMYIAIERVGALSVTVFYKIWFNEAPGFVVALDLESTTQGARVRVEGGSASTSGDLIEELVNDATVGGVWVYADAATGSAKLGVAPAQSSWVKNDSKVNYVEDPTHPNNSGFRMKRTWFRIHFDGQTTAWVVAKRELQCRNSSGQWITYVSYPAYVVAY